METILKGNLTVFTHVTEPQARDAPQIHSKRLRLTRKKKKLKIERNIKHLEAIIKQNHPPSTDVIHLEGTDAPQVHNKLF